MRYPAGHGPGQGSRGQASLTGGHDRISQEQVPSGCCPQTGPPSDPSEHRKFGALGPGPVHVQVVAESLGIPPSTPIPPPLDPPSLPAPDPMATNPPHPGPSAPVKNGKATRTGTVQAIRRS